MIAHAALALACSSLSVPTSATAASLTIGDGVVVKFGQSAGMIVRETLQTGNSVIFTSVKDDAVAGQTSPTAQTPAAGDWMGLQITAAALPPNVNINRLVLLFAGGSGGAALQLQSNAYNFASLLVGDSITGIRVSGGGSVTFTGLAILNNQTGIDVTAGATPTVTGSDIHGNTAFGINNETPATVVQATGNWWGAASGPTDPLGNPGGAGDRVSSGVNYGQYLNAPPLLNCLIAPSNGSYTTGVPTVTLALTCANATQYRVSEDSNFVGATFAAMVPQTSFTLSPAAGIRQVYAQFQGATGALVTVSLAQPINYTPNAPTVTITAPASNATIAANATIVATATDEVGINKVDFYVDNVLLTSVAAPPYSTLWDITNVGSGTHTIKAVATNASQLTAQDTISVTVQKPSDTAGPTITNVQLGGIPLVAGATLTNSATLSFQVADTSGVQSVQVQVDGTAVTGGSLANGQYSILVNVSAVANGSHTLTVVATDSVGNPTTLTYNVNVNISAPAAPTITVPSNGATIRQATFAVSGLAGIGTQVQLYVNGAAAGGLLNTDANGNFSGSVTLAAEGSYGVQADARNSRGTSPQSATMQITYAVAAPTVVFTSPPANATLSNATDISVSVVDAVGVQKVDFSIDGTLAATRTSPPFTYSWNVPAAADGTHTLLAVATNNAGKTGQATRIVGVQNVPPPPPPIVTSYTGAVTTISPAASYGTQPIVITGQAKDRTTSQPVPNATLKLVLQVGGFKRTISIATDAAGAFAYSFVPQTSDAGTYVVSVIHPDETALLNQGQFTINRVNFNISQYSLSAARGIASTIPITATASAGSGTNGLQFQANPSDQPTGSLPAGVTVIAGPTVNLPAGASAQASVSFTGTGTAASGTVILTATASDSGSASRGQVRVDYTLSDPLPALYPTPTFIETGVQQGKSVTETLSLQNKGLAAANNVQLQLQNSNGTTSVPAWIYLGSTGQLGTLGVGQQQTVQIVAMPGTGIADGIYNFRLHVTTSNGGGGDIPVAVSVTQAGNGSVQFNVADIYTNTLDASSQPIPGLANATIKIQNENVLTVLQTVTSNAQGVATATNLPTGTYVYRASAPNHADTSGRLQVRPGVTTPQSVFLDYNVISVEFSVTETTIQDHYDVNLTATYYTQVPAAVVVIEPMSINLPDLQVGEEFTGELTVTNYGLVRADNVVLSAPASDQYYRIELMASLPSQLEAKSRTSIPYRVTALQLLPNTLAFAKSKVIRFVQPKVIERKAGSCSSYSSGMSLSYDYTCANGTTRGASAGSSFNKFVGSSCGGSGGAGGGGGGGGGGGAGGFGGSTSSPAPIPLTPACTPDCPKGVCCLRPGTDPGAGPR